jgi:NADH dehydrogenase
MKVAVIGGTGFVGGYLTAELLKQGHVPVLLVRPGSELEVEQPDACTLVPGDVQDTEALRITLTGCDAVIYLIGILREYPNQGITFEELHYQGAVRTMNQAAVLGVGRFLLMSANGVKALGTPYQTTKYRAEAHLRTTDLDWTIFRPSLIFGDPRSKMEFCTQLKQQMIDPLMPAPLFYAGWLPVNPGAFELSPVYAGDVANAFVRSLDVPVTFRQTYGLGGPEVFTWKALIDTIARACGTWKLTVPAPVFVVRTLAALLEGYDFFPITRDQLTMLMEGNTCDSAAVFELLGITPTRFDTESLAYLKNVP